jgi:hypothetical protein
LTEEIKRQLAELTGIHRGLSNLAELNDETVLSGILTFEASADGFETITDKFEIELCIPHVFPDMMPRARETVGRIERSYPHINGDGTLCLAVPIEERRIFFEQPTLIGFVNRLVIPYLYGYCYWKQHGQHPFDEQQHGEKGIVQHYMDTLHLADELATLAVVCFLFEYGYRGHHPCPCGSGLKVRNCHGPALRELYRHHTAQTVRHDFLSVFEICFSKFQAGQLAFPTLLRSQVLRLLGRVGKRKRVNSGVR